MFSFAADKAMIAELKQAEMKSSTTSLCRGHTCHGHLLSWAAKRSAPQHATRLCGGRSRRSLARSDSASLCHAGVNWGDLAHGFPRDEGRCAGVAGVAPWGGLSVSLRELAKLETQGFQFD